MHWLIGEDKQTEEIELSKLSSKRARSRTAAEAEEPGSGGGSVGGGDAVTRAWETAGSGAVGTSSAEPDAGTSGARGARGADSSRRCSSWPREGNRGGEVRVLLPPFPAEGRTAAVSPFLFFAEGVGLINQG